jgi:hypothetical protein
LAKHFPACGNQHQSKLASLKVQAIFELCSQKWVHFQLGCLTDNDQKASPLIVEHLQPGDLVIRDLGYAVLKVWRQIAQRGAYFLSRCRSDFALFDPKSQQPMEFLDLVQDRSQPSVELLVVPRNDSLCDWSLCAYRLTWLLSAAAAPEPTPGAIELCA